jgi:Na+-driven multidrug efflux pump
MKDSRLARFLSSGVATGAGLQGTVAWINVGCYYVFGVPLALLLGYVADLQVKVINHNYSVYKISNHHHLMSL